jgi:hypothetical protein
MAETGEATEESLCRMLEPWKEGLEDIGEGTEERGMQRQEWALRSHCGGCSGRGGEMGESEEKCRDRSGH